MTNHVHLIVTPPRVGAVGEMLQHIGRRYVRVLNTVHGRTGALWEGRFKSSLIDTDNYLLTCYRYIDLNPVEAGMAPHPAAYPWSSYAHVGEADRSAGARQIREAIKTSSALGCMLSSPQSRRRWVDRYNRQRARWFPEIVLSLFSFAPRAARPCASRRRCCGAARRLCRPRSPRGRCRPLSSRLGSPRRQPHASARPNGTGT